MEINRVRLRQKIAVADRLKTKDIIKEFELQCFISFKIS